MKKINLAIACVAIILCGSLFSFIGNSQAVSVSNSGATAVVQDDASKLQAQVTMVNTSGNPSHIQGQVTVINTSGNPAYVVGTLQVQGNPYSSVTQGAPQTNALIRAAVTNDVSVTYLQNHLTQGSYVSLSGTASSTNFMVILPPNATTNSFDSPPFPIPWHNGNIYAVSVDGTTPNNISVTTINQ